MPCFFKKGRCGYVFGLSVVLVNCICNRYYDTLDRLAAVNNIPCLRLYNCPIERYISLAILSVVVRWDQVLVNSELLMSVSIMPAEPLILTRSELHSLTSSSLLHFFLQLPALCPAFELIPLSLSTPHFSMISFTK